VQLRSRKGSGAVRCATGSTFLAPMPSRTPCSGSEHNSAASCRPFMHCTAQFQSTGSPAACMTPNRTHGGTANLAITLHLCLLLGLAPCGNKLFELQAATLPSKVRRGLTRQARGQLLGCACRMHQRHVRRLHHKRLQPRSADERPLRNTLHQIPAPHKDVDSHTNALRSDSRFCAGCAGESMSPTKRGPNAV
jgi:hypothetical protein